MRSLSAKQLFFLKILAGLLVVAGASWGGFWYGTHQGAVAASTDARGVLLRDNSHQLPHINPLLMCEVTTKEVAELLPIKHALEAQLDALQDAGELQTVSLYVRLLNSGRWFEINPEERYTPASLLKPAMLIAYLRVAEMTPGVLNVQLPFAPATKATAAIIPPAHPLVAGRTYTIGEYLNQLIVESDNQALEVLRTYLSTHYPTALAQTYEDLSLPTENNPRAQSITPRMYSHMFTLLYNATYLGRETSEAGISLLLASAYKQGLVAGVPAGTQVAHKFGERASAKPDGTLTDREFHDCGIVYYPDHPYFICVMTKGDDFARMQRAIADISKATYEQIDAYFKTQR